MRVLTRDIDRARPELGHAVDRVGGHVIDVANVGSAREDVDPIVLTHGAPYGGDDADDDAAPTLLEALDGRRVRMVLTTSVGVTAGTHDRPGARRHDEPDRMPHDVRRYGGEKNDDDTTNKGEQ